ncbi:GNAT family N-acetyltransferase [Iodidimonas sp. SYSU 1G8]|uniref:GNAT family N-acetyltransferase n=1 Tax=Iodidimonas sp. SYSU 1G8 TaxID=3133967 RepID=UPI0031FF3AF3
MRLRRYAPADAPALSSVYVRSVLGLGPRDYRPDQVSAWAGRAPGPDAMAARLGDGRVVIVALGEEDQRVGFCDLEPDGHIDLLYCVPEVAGTRVAAALLERIETEARAQGIARLYTEASEAARRLLLRHGFTELARRDFTLDSVPIHNFAMEKRL